MKNEIIAIKEEVTIGEVVLEKGDRIEIIQEMKKEDVASTVKKFIDDNKPMPVKDLEKLYSQIKNIE